MDTADHKIRYLETMNKGIFIKDIQPSDRIEGLFCVSSKRDLETRNGAPYIGVTLVDRTGEIEGRIWDRVDAMGAVFSQGDYVWIRADSQKFRDVTQLKIVDVRPVDSDSEEPELFLPVTPVDRDELWKEFMKFVRGIRSADLGKLLRAMFGNRRLAASFMDAPAAKKMHHNYIGGLLEHSVSVARLAHAVCGLYRHLDRDLLVAAGLVHDIGKIDEFSYRRPPIDYTDSGRLVGHTVLGIEILDRFLKGQDLEDSSEQIVALKHLILSHHGRQEFGAPVLPMMEEAVILHLIDDLDAKINYLGALKKDISESGRGWTAYQRLFERYFFLGRSAEPEGITAEDMRAGQDATPPEQIAQRKIW